MIPTIRSSNSELSLLLLSRAHKLVVVNVIIISL